MLVNTLSNSVELKNCHHFLDIIFQIFRILIKEQETYTQHMNLLARVPNGISHSLHTTFQNGIQGGYLVELLKEIK